VTKDEVIELIWSEVDLDRADTAFHRTLGGVRRVLDPVLVMSPVAARRSSSGQAIRFEQDRYVLDPRVIGFSDVTAFDAAVDTARATSDPAARRAALGDARSLYRGDYFDDCPYFGDSAEVEPTRSRLQTRMAAVLVMLAELEEERGEVRAAAELYGEALDACGGQDAAAAQGLARLGALRHRLRVVKGRGDLLHSG
jgi:two-component SAPR family response regulator